MSYGEGFRALPAALDPRLATGSTGGGARTPTASAGGAGVAYSTHTLPSVMPTAERGGGAHTPSHAATSRMKAREALAAVRSPMLGAGAATGAGALYASASTSYGAAVGFADGPRIATPSAGGLRRQSSLSASAESSMSSRVSTPSSFEASGGQPQFTGTAATGVVPGGLQGATLSSFGTPTAAGAPAAASRLGSRGGYGGTAPTTTAAPSSALQDEVARLSRLVVQFQQRIEEKEVAEGHHLATIATLEQQVRQLSADNAGYMEKIAAQTDLMQQLGDDAAAVERRNEELTAKARALSDEADARAQAKATADAAHEQELTWLRDAVAQLQSAREAEAQLLSDEIQKAHTLRDDTAAAYETLAAQSDTARAALREAEAKQGDTALRIAALQCELEESEARTAAVSRSHRLFEEKLAHLCQARVRKYTRLAAVAQRVALGKAQQARRARAWHTLLGYAMLRRGDRITTLMKQLEESEKERTRMARVVEVSEQHAAVARRELDDREQRFEDAERRMMALESEAVSTAALQSALNTSKDMIKGLQGDIESLEEELEAAVAANAALSAEKRDLTNARLAARASISTLETAAAARAREMAALTEEVEELRKADTLREAQMQATEQSLAGAAERLKRAEDRQKTEDETVATLRARLDEALSLLPTCEAQRDAAKKEAAAAVARMQTLEAQQGDDETAWNAERERLAERAKAADARVRKLESSRDEAEEALERSRDEVDELRHGLRAAQRERDEERRRAGHLEQAVAEAAEDVRSAEGVIAELKAGAAEAQRELRALPPQEQVAAMQADLVAAKAELLAAGTDLDAVRRTLRVTEEKFEGLHSDAAGATAAHRQREADLQEALDTATRELAALQQTNAALEEQQAAVHAAQDATQTQHARVVDEHRVLKAEKDELVRRNAELEAAAAAAAAAREQVREELAGLTARHTEVAARRDALQKDVTELSRRHATLAANEKELQRRFDAAVTASGAKCKALEEQLADAKEQLETRRSASLSAGGGSDATVDVDDPQRVKLLGLLDYLAVDDPSQSHQAGTAHSDTRAAWGLAEVVSAVEACAIQSKFAEAELKRELNAARAQGAEMEAVRAQLAGMAWRHAPAAPPTVAVLTGGGVNPYAEAPIATLLQEVDRVLQQRAASRGPSRTPTPSGVTYGDLSLSRTPSPAPAGCEPHVVTVAVRPVLLRALAVFDDRGTADTAVVAHARETLPLPHLAEALLEQVLRIGVSPPHGDAAAVGAAADAATVHDANAALEAAGHPPCGPGSNPHDVVAQLSTALRTTAKQVREAVGAIEEQNVAVAALQSQVDGTAAAIAAAGAALRVARGDAGRAVQTTPDIAVFNAEVNDACAALAHAAACAAESHAAHEQLLHLLRETTPEEAWTAYQRRRAGAAGVEYGAPAGACLDDLSLVDAIDVVGFAIKEVHLKATASVRRITNAQCASQEELAVIEERLDAQAPAAAFSPRQLEEALTELETKNDVLAKLIDREDTLRGKMQAVLTRLRAQEERCEAGVGSDDAWRVHDCHTRGTIMSPGGGGASDAAQGGVVGMLAEIEGRVERWIAAAAAAAATCPTTLEPSSHMLVTPISGKAVGSSDAAAVTGPPVEELLALVDACSGVLSAVVPGGGCGGLEASSLLDQCHAVVETCTAEQHDAAAAAALAEDATRAKAVLLDVCGVAGVDATTPATLGDLARRCRDVVSDANAAAEAAAREVAQGIRKLAALVEEPAADTASLDDACGDVAQHVALLRSSKETLQRQVTATVRELEALLETGEEVEACRERLADVVRGYHNHMQAGQAALPPLPPLHLLVDTVEQMLADIARPVPEATTPAPPAEEASPQVHTAAGAMTDPQSCERLPRHRGASGSRHVSPPCPPRALPVRGESEGARVASRSPSEVSTATAAMMAGHTPRVPGAYDPQGDAGATATAPVGPPALQQSPSAPHRVPPAATNPRNDEAQHAADTADDCLHQLRDLLRRVDPVDIDDAATATLPDAVAAVAAIVDELATAATLACRTLRSALPHDVDADTLDDVVAFAANELRRKYDEDARLLARLDAMASESGHVGMDGRATPPAPTAAASLAEAVSAVEAAGYVAQQQARETAGALQRLRQQHADLQASTAACRDRLVDDLKAYHAGRGGPHADVAARAASLTLPEAIREIAGALRHSETACAHAREDLAHMARQVEDQRATLLSVLPGDACDSNAPMAVVVAEMVNALAGAERRAEDVGASDGVKRRLLGLLDPAARAGLVERGGASTEVPLDAMVDELAYTLQHLRVADAQTRQHIGTTLPHTAASLQLQGDAELAKAALAQLVGAPMDAPVADLAATVREHMRGFIDDVCGGALAEDQAPEGPPNANLSTIATEVAACKRALLQVMREAGPSTDAHERETLAACVAATTRRLAALEAAVEKMVPSDVSNKLLARVDELEAVEGELQGARQSVRAILTFLSGGGNGNKNSDAAEPHNALLPPMEAGSFQQTLAELENRVVELKSQADRAGVAARDDAAAASQRYHEDVLSVLAATGWRGHAGGNIRPTWAEVLGEVERRVATGSPSLAVSCDTNADADDVEACREHLASLLTYLAPGRALPVGSLAGAMAEVQKEVISLRAQALVPQAPGNRTPPPRGTPTPTPAHQDASDMEIERLSLELDAMREERSKLLSALRDARRRNPDADAEFASMRAELEAVREERDGLEKVLQSSHAGHAAPPLARPHSAPATPTMNPRNVREDMPHGFPAGDAANELSLCDSLPEAAVAAAEDLHSAGGRESTGAGSDVDRLNREVDGLREEHAHLLLALREAAAQHERELNRLHDEVGAANHQRERVQERVADLRTTAQTSTSAAAGLREENARLQASLTAVITKSAEYEAQAAALAADVDAMAQHCEQLAAGLAEATGGCVVLPAPTLRAGRPPTGRRSRGHPGDAPAGGEDYTYQGIPYSLSNPQSSAQSTAADQISNPPSTVGDGEASCASGLLDITGGSMGTFRAQRRRSDLPSADIAFLSVEPPPPLSRKVSMDGRAICSRYAELEEAEFLNIGIPGAGGDPSAAGDDSGPYPAQYTSSLERQLEASQGKVTELERHISEHLMASARKGSGSQPALPTAPSFILQAQLDEARDKVAKLERKIHQLEALREGVPAPAVSERSGTDGSVVDEGATSAQAQVAVALRKELDALNTSHDSALKELHRHMVEEQVLRREIQELSARERERATGGSSHGNAAAGVGRSRAEEDEKAYLLSLLGEGEGPAAAASDTPLLELRNRVAALARGDARAASASLSPPSDDGDADHLAALRLCALLRERWEAEAEQVARQTEAVRTGALTPDSTFVVAPMSGALLESCEAMDLEGMKEALCCAYAALGEVKALQGNPAAEEPSVPGRMNAVAMSGAAWVEWARAAQPRGNTGEEGYAMQRVTERPGGAGRGRLVAVEGCGWSVPDTRCLPARRAQRRLEEKVARMCVGDGHVDAAIDAWGDEGCPNGVVGEGTAETLAVAQARVLALGGAVSDAVSRLCAMVAVTPSADGETVVHAAYLADVLAARYAAATPATAAPMHPAEHLLLDLYSMSHAEAAAVFGDEHAASAAAPSYMQHAVEDKRGRTLRDAVDTLAKTCLRGSPEDEDAADYALGGRAGMADVASLTRVLHALTTDAGAPGAPRDTIEVYRTVNVSQVIAHDHLQIPLDTIYGWAAPARCSATPQYHHPPAGEVGMAAVAGGDTPSQIYFHLTGITQYAPVPHRPGDVILPPFSRFRITSINASSPYGVAAAAGGEVDAQRPVWIYVEMAYVGCPLKEDAAGAPAGPAAPAIRDAFCEAFDAAIDAAAEERSSVELPKHAQARAAGGIGGGDDAAAALASERRRNAKLRAALDDALQGCDAAAAASHQHDELLKELQTARTACALQKEVADELRVKVAALERGGAPRVDPRVAELEQEIRGLSITLADAARARAEADALKRDNTALHDRVREQGRVEEELRGAVRSLEDATGQAAGQRASRAPAVDGLLEVCAAVDTVRRAARDLRGSAQKSREVAVIVAAVDDAYARTKAVAADVLTLDERVAAPTWLAPSPASGRAGRVLSPTNRARTPSGGRSRRR